jgi:hypothetical protein
VRWRVRAFRQLLEEAEHLVDPVVVACERATTRLVEHDVGREHLSEGVHIAFGEGVVSPTNQIFVGMCHNLSPCTS